MPWGVAAAAVGAYGAMSAAKTNKQAAEAGANQTQKLDPRADAIVYGDGTTANPGLLSQYQDLAKTPQMSGSANFGNQSQQFLGTQGGNILNQLQSGASGLMNNPTAAPQSSAASAGMDPRTYNVQNAQAATVQAPSQNGVGLAQSFNNIIYGDAAANPYLTKSLQAGVDATNAGFQKNANTLADSLQKNLLPSIRSESVLSGQYGGSRQGIAEGNALSDYSRQLTDANSALAAQNSANTTAAQAASYNAGQDRALSATQTLSGQQYGVAQQNAAQAQQTAMANAAAQNASSAQNANAYNNHNQFNAGLQQQTGLANQSAQLQTNALNSTNQQAGLAGLSGLLGNVYGYAQNQDNYAINRAGQVNGLLAPYLGAGGSTNTTQPYASNTGANILGGATAGLGLFNGIKQSGAFGSWGTPNAQNVAPGSYQPNAQNITPGTY